MPLLIRLQKIIVGDVKANSDITPTQIMRLIHIKYHMELWKWITIGLDEAERAKDNLWKCGGKL